MISIRLRVAFHFDHCEIPEGTVIAAPSELAHMLVSRGVAERAEPERGIIEPQETRTVARPHRRIQ